MESHIEPTRESGRAFAMRHTMPFLAKSGGSMARDDAIALECGVVRGSGSRLGPHLAAPPAALDCGPSLTPSMEDTVELGSDRCGR